MQLLCPACSQATAQYLLYSKNGCDILRCDECGLGRARASSFDPGAYYTGDYFSGGYADGYAASGAARAPFLTRRRPKKCRASASPFSFAHRLRYDAKNKLELKTYKQGDTL